MKSLEEATQIEGVTRKGTGLNLHFSPIPNWYGCITGFDCPRCDNQTDWQWEGKFPNLIRPIVTGAKLVEYGHRWIELVCSSCQTNLFAENFDGGGT